MYKGKILSLVAGIITLVATFLFSWLALEIGAGDTVYFVNGIAILKKLPDLFTDAESLGSTLEIPVFAFYIIAGIFALFLASGVLQILGMKHRFFVILGSMAALGIGSLLFLSTIDVIDKANWVYYILGTEDPIIENIVPLTILELNTFDIGLYLLIAGGVLGIIASIYGPGPF